MPKSDLDKQGVGVFFGARRHTFGCVISAALLLGLASLGLMLAAFMGLGDLALLGQILFVIFVFASVTLLLITAIAQDIRFRGDRGS